MRYVSKKRIVIFGALLLAFLGFAAYLFFLPHEEERIESPQPVPEVPTKSEVRHSVIGTSVEGREINAYTYGDGAKRLLFVGGIHGGYEWNSVLLAYTYMDYLAKNLSSIPDGLSVTIIPSLNPDGVYRIVGTDGPFSVADVKEGGVSAAAARFNANGVDLNRNFDCKWKPESMWRGNVVSAGTEPFSEPEAQALRDFVSAHNPVAVVFWHSQSNAVYASECEEGILPATRALMNVYATAAEYPAVDVFDAYEITGDAEGWLASIGIPAITVELSTHETIEWQRNLKGSTSVLNYFAAQ
jgi:predicted deacylase